MADAEAEVTARPGSAATAPAHASAKTHPAEPDPTDAQPDASPGADGATSTGSRGRTNPGTGTVPAGQPPARATITRRPRAQVQIKVTMPLTTLLGLTETPGYLPGYGPLPADLARELAADATWKRLITDPTSGALLDHGMTRYRPPKALAEFVQTRSQTCDFPGCRVPAHRCDIDHTIPHNPATGTGPTSERNNGPRCRTHHLLKHSPGWHVIDNPDGSTTWITPTGHRLTRHPPQIGPITEPSKPPPAPEPDPPPF